MPCHNQNRLAQLILISFPVISDQVGCSRAASAASPMTRMQGSAGRQGTGDHGGRADNGWTTGGRALPCILVIGEAALAAGLVRNY